MEEKKHNRSTLKALLSLRASHERASSRFLMFSLRYEEVLAVVSSIKYTWSIKFVACIERRVTEDSLTGSIEIREKYIFFFAFF